MMALGVLNVVVPCLWLYLRYWWNEFQFSFSTITFDRRYLAWCKWISAPSEYSHSQKCCFYKQNSTVMCCRWQCVGGEGGTRVCRVRDELRVFRRYGRDTSGRVRPFRLGASRRSGHAHGQPPHQGKTLANVVAKILSCIAIYFRYLHKTSTSVFTILSAVERAKFHLSSINIYAPWRNWLDWRHLWFP